MRKSMSKIQKKMDDDGDYDRISSLPGNVIELIMELLSFRDVTRTSVLSKDWRYVWAEHPSMILDKEFWDDINRHIHNVVLGEVSIDFFGIVNRILVNHVGNIEHFDLDISVIPSEQHSHINSWLSLVCKKGVKTLSLDNSSPEQHILQNLPSKRNDPYTVPSCVFSTPGLIYLSFSNCIINTKESCFNRLQALTLHLLNLDSWVLTTPLLDILIIEHCSGTRGFSISAPKLEALYFMYNEDFNLMPYLKCTNISHASIFVCANIKDLGKNDSEINLLKLHSCWPKLKILTMDGRVLKYLTTGIVLENLSLELNLREFRVLCINVDQIVWILRILQNSPWLKKFDCSLHADGGLTNGVQLLNYSDIMKMEQLHTVRLSLFNGSEYELVLVKILLQCSSSLKQMMFVVNEQEMNSDERIIRILQEVMSFPRASTKAEIAFEKSK